MIITRRLLIGVFYAVVLLLVTPVNAGAGNLTPSQVDWLERALREAWEIPGSPEGPYFAAHFASLEHHYRETGRLQELAWLYAEYDWADRAAAVENEMLLQMKTAQFAEPLTPLFPNNNRVFVARLTSGLKVVVTKSDQRIPQETLPAYMDQRRHAVAVYEIARALGFRIVPATAYALVDGHIESIRAWIGDAQYLDVDHRAIEYRDEELHVLDYLTEQLDRNHDGLVVRPGGFLVAMDNKHALDFGKRGLIDATGLPSMYPPTGISERTREGLLHLRDRLERGSIGQFRGLNVGEISRLESKIQHLLTLPTRADAPRLRFGYSPELPSRRELWRKSFQQPVTIRKETKSEGCEDDLLDLA